LFEAKLFGYDPTEKGIAIKAFFGLKANFS
jgi:hypothetical protein